MVKFLISAVSVALSIVIIVMLLIYFFQNRLIYPAPYIQLPEPQAENIKKIALGDTYAYLIMPTNIKAKIPLIIYTHGNGELAEMWVDDFNYIVSKGYAALLVEYPGYGTAGGKPNFSSIKQTMLSAYDAMLEMEQIDSEKIVAYGRSLGGAAASLLAENRPFAALILESTFSSLPKLVKEKGFPSFLLKDRYDNEAIVRTSNIQLLIYHGTRDNIIPYSHAESLYRTRDNITLHSADCGHNDCPRIWKKIIPFLETHL